MTLEATLWDCAELLDSREAVLTYIDAALEAGDPALISHALGIAQLTQEEGLALKAAAAAATEKGDLDAFGVKLALRAA